MMGNPLDTQAVGFALRDARKKAGLSLRQAAAAANIPFRRIADIEAGKKKPSPGYLARLAHAYQTDPAPLFLAQGLIPPKTQAAILAYPDWIASIQGPPPCPPAQPHFALSSPPPKEPKKVPSVPGLDGYLVSPKNLARQLLALHAKMNGLTPSNSPPPHAVALVTARSKEGFSANDLAMALRGYSCSPWHLEHGHTHFSLALRSPEHVEKGRALYLRFAPVQEVADYADKTGASIPARNQEIAAYRLAKEEQAIIKARACAIRDELQSRGASHALENSAPDFSQEDLPQACQAPAL